MYNNKKFSIFAKNSKCLQDAIKDLSRSKLSELIKEKKEFFAKIFSDLQLLLHIEKESQNISDSQIKGLIECLNILRLEERLEKDSLVQEFGEKTAEVKRIIGVVKNEILKPIGNQIAELIKEYVLNPDYGKERVARELINEQWFLDLILYEISDIDYLAIFELLKDTTVFKNAEQGKILNTIKKLKGEERGEKVPEYEEDLEGNVCTISDSDSSSSEDSTLDSFDERYNFPEVFTFFESEGSLLSEDTSSEYVSSEDTSSEGSSLSVSSDNDETPGFPHLDSVLRRFSFSKSSFESDPEDDHEQSKVESEKYLLSLKS